MMMRVHDQWYEVLKRRRKARKNTCSMKIERDVVNMRAQLCRACACNQHLEKNAETRLKSVDIQKVISIKKISMEEAHNLRSMRGHRTKMVRTVLYRNEHQCLPKYVRIYHICLNFIYNFVQENNITVMKNQIQKKPNPKVISAKKKKNEHEMNPKDASLSQLKHQKLSQPQYPSLSDSGCCNSCGGRLNLHGVGNKSPETPDRDTGFA